ncbi:TlyA family RNA methyltransferase [Bacillus sp. Marseille-P3800]|uniref:TlyA family RNA methyltransferase n=1 Tax=Bacillus sp. Marseille-P3800 TaxID=2014782 RepID=UPI000C075955|nr:TlyA family RNA methyltransferase [Bacillus sp. Marseille-P3800]
MGKKERLDVLLVERGLADTREKAKRSIMAGLVFSEHERLDKPGLKVDSDLPIRIKGDTLKYVSRGGLKLEKALEVFELEIKDKVGLDIGASTGGFTDCALQNDAKSMYAVDVGYNQLAWKIRQDDRVTVMERMNFRYATQSDFTNERPQFASIDVSFISLKLILPPLFDILSDEGDVIALIKPQFEAGREHVGKKGIVRDPLVHKDVIETVLSTAHTIGFSSFGLAFSPITGGDGNIEFLLHLKKRATVEKLDDEEVKRIVDASQALRKKE